MEHPYSTLNDSKIIIQKNTNDVARHITYW